MYIDDLQWDVEADTEWEAATAFVDIGHVLCDAIQVDMRADLAYDKAAVVASAPGKRRSDRLARLVRKRLGRAGGNDVVAVHNLGIDCAAGRMRKEWASDRGTMLRKRYHKGARRAARAAVLRRSLASGSRHKAKRLFAGNVRAVAFYGAEVHGLSDAQLAAAWRLAAKYLSPATPGRSVEALALTNLDAVGPLPYAQALRWASEVWRASCRYDHMAIPISKLGDCYRAVAAWPPSCWREVRRPVGGAILELRRLGWSFGQGGDAPYVFVTDLGDSLPLTRVSPAALRVQLAAAYGRHLERKLAAKWRVTSDDGDMQQGLRLAHEPVVRAIKSAKVGKVGRGAERAFACNAVWIRERLVRVGGLMLDVTCPLCGAGPDTMWHRLWLCNWPEVVQQRDKLPVALVRRAREAGPASPLYARGWMVHPADAWPRPANIDQCLDNVRFRARQDKGDFADVLDANAWQLSGSAYPDGSCLPHVLSELVRASWGAAVLDDDGTCTATVSGTVPSTVTQSSVAAEWCAFAAVAELATGPVDARRTARRLWTSGLSRSGCACGLTACTRDSLRSCAATARLATLRCGGPKGTWPKMQRLVRRPSTMQGGTTWAMVRPTGAMPRHPQPPDWLRDRVAREVKDVQAVILYAASILHLWPKASKQEIAAARPARAARPRRVVERAHQRVSLEGRWQCKACLATTFSAEGVRRRSKEECIGHARPLQSVLRGVSGHLLMAADVDSGPCVFCAACGAWCTSKPRDLLQPCGGRMGRTAAGMATLVKFRNGLVPDCGDRKGRRVYGVCALQSGAAPHWDCIAATEGCTRPCSGPIPDPTEARGGGGDGTPDPTEVRSGGGERRIGGQGGCSSIASFGHFGGDPVGRAFATVVERGRLRAASAPSSFDQIHARVAQRAASRRGTPGEGPTPDA